MHHQLHNANTEFDHASALFGVAIHALWGLRDCYGAPRPLIGHNSAGATLMPTKGRPHTIDPQCGLLELPFDKTRAGEARQKLTNGIQGLSAAV